MALTIFNSVLFISLMVELLLHELGRLGDHLLFMVTVKSH